MRSRKINQLRNTGVPRERGRVDSHALASFGDRTAGVQSKRIILKQHCTHTKEHEHISPSLPLLPQISPARQNITHQSKKSTPPSSHNNQSSISITSVAFPSPFSTLTLFFFFPPASPSNRAIWSRKRWSSTFASPSGTAGPSFTSSSSESSSIVMVSITRFLPFVSGLAGRGGGVLASGIQRETGRGGGTFDVTLDFEEVWRGGASQKGRDRRGEVRAYLERGTGTRTSRAARSRRSTASERPLRWRCWPRAGTLPGCSEEPISFIRE